ncbi:regulatory protein RecX [Blastococcus sp. TML/M2B]|uniref:regulatory protein RecX n=2 Tax=unclassified Blastococcus TaxID=2619396 RepID=UPI00190CC953|nr:regulatory protein RecX [Blastococcus sp. TML/M2B]MBN1093478.1 regulatory protein RecX [Blastococcus sp. TML/M2B]MBN1096406.1 regulatory protein RecX [Blastococcus sp. TML/C7B]
MTERSAGRRRAPQSSWGTRRRPSTAGGAEGADGVEARPMKDPEAVARDLCLRALTGAPKTRQQLADLLAQREVPEDAAETVLDRLTEVGLIDDEAFAQAWVTSRQAGRGLARRALKAELRAKGVDDEVAAIAVEAVDDDDERETARRLVERKLPAMRRLDRATATRRLMGVLARKGYSGGLAAGVVREALDADGADDDAVPGVDELDQDALLP